MRINHLLANAGLLGIFVINLACGLYAPSAMAGEALYVSERQTLSIYQDTSLSTRVATLKSGDQG